MGASVRPDPVADYLAAKQQTGDPVADYLSAKGGHDYHAEFKSGALEKRMQGANDRDMASATDPDQEAVSGPMALVHSAAATGANLAQGIPGMEAVQAGARKLIRRQPYGEALSDIRGSVNKIQAPLRAGERIAGALPLTKFLPANPVTAGAVLGGADAALSADPDKDLEDRAGGAAMGAVAGAATGKAAEFLGTGTRTLLAKNPATNLLQRQAARAASAKQLYGAALKEGQGKTGTAAVQKFLAEPDIAEMVSELKQTRPFQQTPEDSPEMLDAVYKTLSDRAAGAKRGLDAVTPSRPNIGRFRLKDTRAAQNDLLDAASGGASMPGPMPTYRTAVQDYADRSGGIDAVRRGYDAVRTGIKKTLPTAKNLTRTTPEAAEEWGTGITPQNADDAAQGVLGATKMAVKSAPLTEGRRAILKAPSIMRKIGAPSQSMADLLTRLGLVGANAARQP